MGSVVTQTMLRDSYQGSDLARVFSVMGIALSLSPVLGLLSGGQLASGFGYLGVFSGLLVLVLSWATRYRVVALGAVIIVYTIPTLLAWRKLCALVALGADSFAATREELASDLAELRSAL